MSDQFQFAPGKAALETVVHSNGTATADITDLVREVNIHSSVNIKSTIIEFVVLDTISYLSKAPIQPGDVISVSIGYADGSIERRVKVMEINSINAIDGRNVSYIIKCSSNFRFTSIHARISRAFHGLPNEIAYVILRENGGEDNGVWEPSRDNFSFVAPNWDPIKCIKYLATQSHSVEFPERMMFFQDSRMKYHFTSLSNINKLYSSNDDMITYTYGKNTQSIETPAGQVPNTESVGTAILNLKYLNSFNYEDAVNSGNLKNTNYTYDITTGKLYVQTNDRWDTYNQNSANSGNLYPVDELGQGKVTIDYINSLSTLAVPSPNQSVNFRYGYDRTQEVEIEILGNHVSDIGQMVNLEIISREAGNGGQAGLDPRWSGKYTVTAKRDVHTKDTHKMVLRCTKNSIDPGAAQ